MGTRYQDRTIIVMAKTKRIENIIFSDCLIKPVTFLFFAKYSGMSFVSTCPKPIKLTLDNNMTRLIEVETIPYSYGSSVLPRMNQKINDRTATENQDKNK